MSYKTVLPLVVIVQLLGVPHLVHTACPSTTQQAVQQLLSCVTKFGQVTDFTKPSASAEKITEYCDTSADQEATCVDRVLDDCRRTSPAISRQFDKFVNPNGMRGAIGVVCEANNTAELIAKKSCIGTQQTGVNSCIASRLSSYDAQVSTLKQQAFSRGQQWFLDEAQKTLCEYQSDVKSCQRPYKQFCGKRVGDIFDAIHSSTVPPVCGTVAIKQSLSSLLTALVLSAVFIFRT